MNEEQDTSSLPILKKEKEQPQWFAMRATYRCELKMRDKLKAVQLECFVPLTIVEKKVGTRKKRIWQPAINSLIFVYGLKSLIQEFKKREPRLQYICKTVPNGTKTPIVVPEEQMNAFIKLYENTTHEITEAETNFKPGMRVKVISGPFEGMTGTFQRIKGHRERRFIVTLDQLVFISTTDVSPDMLEELKES